METFIEKLAQVMTAIVAGGGANLLHDLFDHPGRG